MRGRAALGLVAAALVGLLAALAPAAVAQTGDDAPPRTGGGLVVREVDATDPDAVLVTYFSDEPDAEVALHQGGRAIEPAGAAEPYGALGRIGVVLVIDVSAAMDSDAAIERTREAAAAFVEAKDPADEVAVVAFSDTVTLLQSFTADEAPLLAAIDRLGTIGVPRLYDGVVRAAALLDDTALQPNVVLVSSGPDQGSLAGFNRAAGALSRTGGTLFAAVLERDGVDHSSTVRLATESGGQAVSLAEPTGLEAALVAFGDTLRDQRVVTFAGDVAVPSDLTLRVGSSEVTVGFTFGARVKGPDSLALVPAAQPAGPEFFRTSGGLALGLLLVLGAVFVAAWSLGSTFATRDDGLAVTLRPYEEGYVAGVDGGDDDDGPGSGMAQTAILQRAVSATERFAERQGFLETIEGKLERANLPLRPAEAIFFYATAALLLFVLTAFMAGSVVVVLVVGLLAVILPPAVLNMLAARRKKAFQTLLPDTLQLLASTLRAGYSLMQGVEAVSTEVAEPMGRELRRVVTEARLGRPLEESLEAVSVRLDSPDFAWAVMAIRIQREVGGNLSELLVTVADTMTERERLRRDVSALTAEGRVSAVILGILPLAIGGFIWSANPEYLDPLFERTAGQIMIGGAVLLMLGGFLWMKKIIEIDI